MENKTRNIVEHLKKFKSSGLSYYDALENLKKLGFSQEQIDDAADIFPYQTSQGTEIEEKETLNTVASSLNPKYQSDQSSQDKSLEKIIEINEDPNKQKAYAASLENIRYSSVIDNLKWAYIPAMVGFGSLGFQITKLLLVNKLFAHDVSKAPLYAWKYPAVGGLVGMVFGFIFNLTLIRYLRNKRPKSN